MSRLVDGVGCGSVFLVYGKLNTMWCHTLGELLAWYVGMRGTLVCCWSCGFDGAEGWCILGRVRKTNADGTRPSKPRVSLLGFIYNAISKSKSPLGWYKNIFRSVGRRGWWYLSPTPGLFFLYTCMLQLDAIVFEDTYKWLVQRPSLVYNDSVGHSGVYWSPTSD